MSTKNAAQQVSHWVHDEVSCVTVQRIVQTFHLSWSASLALLKEIPKGGKEYSVTVLSSTDPGSSDSNSEVIRLVPTSLNDDSKPEDSASWYALALASCNESVQAACERDRSQFHENMAEFTLDDASDFLAVPEPMKARMELNQGKRTAADAFDDEPKARKTTKSAPIVAKKISSTTAKDFFSSKGKNASTKTTTASTSTTSSKSKSHKTMAKSKQSSSFFQPKKGGGSQQSASSKAAKKKSADEEKENVQNKSSEVGNADDFVGDVDDEDDDDDVEDEASVDEGSTNQKPKAAAAKRGAPKREEPVEILDDDDDDEESEEKSDSRAEKKANDGPKPRRRKKVMEEKNFADEHGYFYTKTVAVWKDVESDEEEKFPVKSKAFNQPPSKGNKGKKKTARPNQMKQQTLKGFFAKKK